MTHFGVDNQEFVLHRLLTAYAAFVNEQGVILVIKVRYTNGRFPSFIKQFEKVKLQNT